MKLPRYSYKQLELKASDVINFFAPEYLSNSEAVPIQFFVDKLESLNKLKFGIKNLGFVNANSKILGLFISQPSCELYIDESIVDSIRYNFTLAHELGHFVLHRKVDIGGNIAETSANLNETPASLQSDRQWAEWQANNFAACLLLPKQSFLAFITSHAHLFEIALNNNKIEHKNTLRHSSNIEKLAEYTAHNFAVSKTTVLIRMKKLQII